MSFESNLNPISHRLATTARNGFKINQGQWFSTNLTGCMTLGPTISG